MKYGRKECTILNNMSQELTISLLTLYTILPESAPKSGKTASVLYTSWLGAIQVLRNAVGGGRVSDFPEKKRYEEVRLNVISITRGWVSVEFPEKNVTKTLEWSLTRLRWGCLLCIHSMPYAPTP